jgi:hypothetical protein
MQLETRVNINLNCKAKGLAVGGWPDDVISGREQEIARRTLLAYFDEREGYLVPLVNSDPGCLVPDEVVITDYRDGKVLARWNIVDEMNARARRV